ncbi:hypothetical protein DIPPA_15256 [Diplonema papillatum]|nr:hypothetical protein DIPPA_15256 [Diplonema papillatum]
MSLTALELYEELKERGVCSAELRAYVDASVKKAGDLPEDDISTEAGILQPTPAPMDGRLREALAENAMLKKQLAAVHRDGFATTNITNCPGSYESPQVLTAELHQLSLQLKKLEDRESALLQVIAERLPTIITSVRTSRKECLVQVLLAIIQQHSDPKVRTSLLFHYVTLFKRPDGEQRGLIVDGFKQVAQILSRSDPRRIETEILASLSVLTQNRYPEHRVLAIEATSALYEYLRPALQRELLTDVFHEWERDASGLVRETVVKTIAGMADTTNVRLCCPFLVSGLTDGSQRVLKAAVQSTKHLAALAVVERCLVPCIVDPLAATLAVDSSPPTVERTNLRFSAFSCLLDAVKEELAQTVPASIGSRSAALSLLVTKAIQRQVKGQWPAIEWLVGPFVTRVLSAIVTTAKMDTSKGAQNAKRGRDAVAPRELDGVHPPVSADENSGVTLNALLQSLRGLSKAMNDPVLSPLLGSTLVHLEAFVDRDEKENKRDRLFAKFRDLLPTNEHPTLDSRDRVPVPKPTSGTPKHDHAPHHSPSADDMPDISCLYPVNTNLSVTPAAYQAKNRSLFSKVQQKLFGGVD